MSVSINDDGDGSAVLDAGKDAQIVVLVKNTLEQPIYDMRVEVTPKGNLVRDNLVSTSGGFMILRVRLFAGKYQETLI